MNETADVQIAVTVNGRARAIPANMSISELIASLELQERLVVVERNGEIIPRAEYGSVLLADSDVLEIVHFVGGG